MWALKGVPDSRREETHFGCWTGHGRCKFSVAPRLGSWIPPLDEKPTIRAVPLGE
jgi:hypothetical protein